MIQKEEKKVLEVVGNNMVRRKFKQKPGTPRKIVKKERMRHYPVIYCPREDVVVGLSYKPMRFKANRFGKIVPKYKVNKKHWLPQFCHFKSQEYVIDLREFKDGQEICCPKCGTPVDFRLFPSATSPKLI